MRKRILYLILLYFSIFYLSNSANLTIERSWEHEDKSGNYTPLVVSLTTEDTEYKAKPVDLICIVDVSGSMYGDKIDQVKYSLNYLVNRSESIDNFALVTFSSSSKIVHNFTKMTEENKSIFRKSIENLIANGDTNIYSGLEKGLNLLNNDYSSGERIASMILLSDGHDNYNPSGVISNFKNLMKTKNKTDYAFTVHTFGYGDNYNYELLKDISLIMDGSFFHVFNLAEIGDYYLTIYGFLSTVMDVNVKLEIESQFEIIEVYGQEDMHKAILKRDTISSFSVENIHIGDNVRIDDFCILSGRITIGDNIHIAAYSALYGGDAGIFVCDFANVSSRVCIYALSDDYSGETMTNPMIPEKYKNLAQEKVYIGRHVIIGSGCTILPGVSLKEGTAIGSMSLVKESTEPWKIYGGIPARFLKDRSMELLKLEKEFLESTVI